LVAKMQCYLLDGLASGVNGRSLPWSVITSDLVESRGGRPDASVLGRADRFPTSSAAWANGILIGANELDHGAYQAHPASTVLPAALAIAESRACTGGDLLAAMAVGYEVACRVGDAGTRSVEDDRHFHNPGAGGPFGAAAAAALLLGLDTATTASALGIAGSSSAGLTEYLNDGTMTKRLHLGAAARGGLEAAELAAAGFTGPATVLEGSRGYLAAFAQSSEPDRLTDRLGERWLAGNMQLKDYPCHGTLQGVVGGLSGARARLAGSRSVRGVVVRLGPGERLTQPRFHVRAPATLIEAQYSLPYCVAAALCRDLSRPSGFGADVLTDPEVQRLSQATTWEPSPSTGISLELELQDGDSIRVSVETLQTPIGFAGACARFARQVEDSLSPRRIAQIIDLVEQSSELTDAGELVRAVNAGLLDDD
jgi:2-methylcitrate dehydratase PrpD